MGTLFLPAAQNDQEMQADLQSQLSPSVGRAYSQVYNFDVLEFFTGAMVKQHALNDIANTGEKLSVDQLRKEYPDGLVNFDRPLTRAQAELIRDRKREEIQRQDIWQRAEGWATASGVTASLAAGVVDPVFTAVGIVMAPAKGIQMLGGLRAMAASSSLAYSALGTAGLTAVDAALAIAILEPYNLYSHQQYYADYTMANSLANVVFGGVFGGAFGGGVVILGRGLSHVGKWTPEWLKGKQEATHETSLHTAVAQVLDGRPVQVEPILRSDPNLRMAEGHPVQAAEMAGPRVDESAASPHMQDQGTKNVLSNLRESVDHLNAFIRNGEVVPKVDEDYAQMAFGKSALEVERENLTQWQKELAAIESNLHVTTQSVFRGIGEKEARILDKATRGKKRFQLDDRYRSATRDIELATSYAKKAVVEILPGARALDFDAVTGIHDGTQHVLIARNQQYTVRKSTTPGVDYTLSPKSGEFTAASGKEVLDQAKQHMEAPRTGAADDVAENFDAEIQATHADTADYYEPAAKTRKMMELEKEIEYQQLRLAQEHGDVQVDGLKQADDALSKADDLRAAMVEGMACLLRR